MPSRKKRVAGDNPWGVGATTLEWTLPSPPPFHQYDDAAAHHRQRSLSAARWTLVPRSRNSSEHRRRIAEAR